MFSSNFFRPYGAILFSLTALACGPEFVREEQIQGLRVLAVQKNDSYPAPGSTADLTLLWHDSAERPVTRAWFPPCFNPPGDQYFGCLSELTKGGNLAESAERNSLAHQIVIPDQGDTVSVEIPADIITRRPPPKNPDQFPYGITYMFFAVCAGRLEVLFNTNPGAYPLACYDESGNRLGAEGFVIGYTTLYSFETIRNQNPIIQQVEFRGQLVTPDCIGTECTNAAPLEPNCADESEANRCIPSCADDGKSSCPDYTFKPIVDPASAEDNPLEITRKTREQMWVRYYTERGTFDNPVRLLNDATTGWNEKYETKFFAPRLPGLNRIWAVVHDNRGGVNLARITVRVVAP